MAVELHYEDEVIVEDPDGAERLELRHWRIIVNDEDAAIAQAAQDVAEGRNPISVVARTGSDPWDYRAEYNARNWKTLVPKARLRDRARAHGPTLT